MQLTEQQPGPSRSPHGSVLFHQVPNVPGIVTSLLRFWLFWQYPPSLDKPYKSLQA